MGMGMQMQKRERQGWLIAKPAVYITRNNGTYQRGCCQTVSKRKEGGGKVRICKSCFKTKGKERQTCYENGEGRRDINKCKVEN